MRSTILLLSFISSVHFAYSQPGDPPAMYGIDASFGTPSGLMVGENAPKFTAFDAVGKEINLSEELKEGPVVLIFYRGEWCPVCNRYLSNFQDSLSYVQAAGAKVIAVAPEITSSANKMIKKTGATFTVIPDPSEQIMRDYKVIFRVTDSYQNKIRTKLEADIATNNAKEDANLPVPATFIINKTGVVVYRQFDLDYHKRASIKDIINNIPK